MWDVFHVFLPNLFSCEKLNTRSDLIGATMSFANSSHYNDANIANFA